MTIDMDMRKHFKQQTDLANDHFNEGEYLQAAKVFAKLAILAKIHAARIEKLRPNVLKFDDTLFQK